MLPIRRANWFQPQGHRWLEPNLTYVQQGGKSRWQMPRAKQFQGVSPPGLWGLAGGHRRCIQRVGPGQPLPALSFAQVKLPF